MHVCIWVWDISNSRTKFTVFLSKLTSLILPILINYTTIHPQPLKQSWIPSSPLSHTSSLLLCPTDSPISSHVFLDSVSTSLLCCHSVLLRGGLRCPPGSPLLQALLDLSSWHVSFYIHPHANWKMTALPTLKSSGALCHLLHESKLLAMGFKLWSVIHVLWYIYSLWHLIPVLPSLPLIALEILVILLLHTTFSSACLCHMLPLYLEWPLHLY